MCRDCGCEQASQEHAHWVGGREVRHTHDRGHDHGGGHASRVVVEPRRIFVGQSILAKNDAIANNNRSWFKSHGIQVLNLISAPGSGKTLLLEKTVTHLARESRVVILTGDQEEEFDAQRLRAVGAEVRQLNTGSSCHLDASMIERQLGGFVRPVPQLLIIENEGNLVCPAAFYLGETMKVALLSSTEGEDKPSKYPLLFREAGVVVLTKMDLAPHLDWDVALCEKHIRRVNASAPILRLSARTGEGLEPWLAFLRGRAA
jgi:hydrogenase nickel incorporation protein HypB